MELLKTLTDNKNQPVSCTSRFCLHFVQVTLSLLTLNSKTHSIFDF